MGTPSVSNHRSSHKEAERSIDLRSFSVTSGFPTYCVHDLLEGGTISIEVKFTLNHVLKTYKGVYIFS